MAVIDYNQRGVRRPTTANNQNQMAQNTGNLAQLQNQANAFYDQYQQQQQQARAQQNLAQTNNVSASPWTAPSATRVVSGPYNPNSPQQPAPQKTNPWQTGPYNPNPPGSPSTPQSPWQQPSQSSYTPSQLPPWTPQVPVTPQYTPYTPYTPPTWGNPNNTGGTPWKPSDFNTQAGRDMNTAYMQATLPYLQFQQNNSQYANDFNESARRDDRNFLEQQRMNNFNMDITGQQQQLAQWAQQEQARQFAEQFNHGVQNDYFSQDLANRQFNQQDLELARRYGLDERQLTELVNYRNQQDALARWQQEQQMLMLQQQLEAQRQNAILQATGRAGAQAPNTQWMRRF